MILRLAKSGLLVITVSLKTGMFIQLYFLIRNSKAKILSNFYKISKIL